MASVLYISYTGLSDPLGESQVLQYLLRLAQKHRISLITFEKPELISRLGEQERLTKLCGEAGIEWIALTYHRKPSMPATFYDIAKGISVALRIARRNRVEIVHGRSYIAGVIALATKRITGARYVFDMRGFWADERVDGGIWPANSMLYRLFKRVERHLFLGADHVVSLTRAGIRAYSEFPWLKDRVPPSTVIPTCTNLDTFYPRSKAPGLPFTLGYVGSAGTWYLFPEVARAVRILFEIDPEARFLVVNRSEHKYIRECLSREGVALGRVDIGPASFNEVPAQIARMSAGIFFIKPVFSKRASCPTKMGEFLGCGVPCFANVNIGDVAEVLSETATGLAVADFSDATLSNALTRLIALAAEPDIGARCRKVAEEGFSLEEGVSSYEAIYERLAKVRVGQ